GKSGAPTDKGDTASVAPSVTGLTASAPTPTVKVATFLSLREYATAVARWRRIRQDFNVSVKTVATNAEAPTAICSPPSGRRGEAPPADVAMVTRRMTPAESDTCKRNFENVSEVPMGAQAIVVARSKLYGPLELSARDLFLALAAEVPDVAHPGAIIPNPYTN